jgi:hypothetical protein
MHELTIDQLETVSAAADSRFTFSIMGLADVTSIHYDSRGSGAVECHAVQSRPAAQYHSDAREAASIGGLFRRTDPRQLG